MVSQSCYRIWQAGFFFSSLFQTPPRDEVFWEYKGGLGGRKKAQLRICSALCGRTEEKERWLNGSSLRCEKQPGGSGLAWALQAKNLWKRRASRPKKGQWSSPQRLLFFHWQKWGNEGDLKWLTASKCLLALAGLNRNASAPECRWNGLLRKG